MLAPSALVPTSSAGVPAFAAEVLAPGALVPTSSPGGGHSIIYFGDIHTKLHFDNGQTSRIDFIHLCSVIYISLCIKSRLNIERVHN